MSSTWPRAVVFDLDGTLIDSAPDLALHLNDVMREEGLAEFSLDEVRGIVGGGLKALLERAFAAHGERPRSASLDSLTAKYLSRYMARPVIETRLYPGAADLLEQLGKRGHALGLCTNKPALVTRKIVDELGITAHFKAIVGGEADVPKKPHRAMLDLTLDKLGAGASNAIMVGDSGADVGTARAAGVPVLLVSYGYTLTPAGELGADLVIDHLSETERAFRDLAQRLKAR